MKNISVQEKNFKRFRDAVEMVRSGLLIDEEGTLAARAAWFYFAGGKTQGEVAELLGLPNTKTHRLIARANRDGLIRVFVEGPIGGCIALEEDLKKTYALAQCEVVPNIDEGALPLRTLGMAGARYMCHLIESSKYDLIGIGHGRTLAAAIDLLPTMSAKGIRFVSLLGGLTRRFAASPFDVIHRLAERTGAEAYIMPVPFFANTVKDKKVFETQFGVSDVILMARQAQLYVAGIGEVGPQSFIATGGMIDENDISAIRLSGATGEILGQFFKADGTHISSAISDRALAPSIDNLKQHKIVALAGGTSKTQAIRAILESGLLFGLITDEATARRLLSDKPGREPGKKNGKTAAD